MNFRLMGLSPAPFAPLFAMSDSDLAAHRAVRCVADACPGFPCRVSLQDAEPGEDLVLANYRHQPADTPYQSAYAVYVRAAARQAYDRVNQVPEMLRGRMLSLRGFGADHMLVDADLADGRDAEAVIQRLLADARTHYLHIHLAKPGCYAARVERA